MSKVIPGDYRTFRGCIEHALDTYQRTGAGVRIELRCTPGTRGPKPGAAADADTWVPLMPDAERISWGVREYPRRAGHRIIPGKHAQARTTSEAEAILREWGYSPDAPCWMET